MRIETIKFDFYNEDDQTILFRILKQPISKSEESKENAENFK